MMRRRAPWRRTAAVRPLATRAQQPEQIRRIGILIGDHEDDPEVKVRLAAFRQGLEQLGWSVDRNLRIEYRFAADKPDQFQPLATTQSRLTMQCQSPEPVFPAPSGARY
jgi:DNA-binding LacI/PurR family transcriptional regulator